MTKAVTFWIPELLNLQRASTVEEELKKINLPWLSLLLTKADALPINNKTQNFYQTASYLFHQPKMLPIAPTLASTELSSVDKSLFWLKVDPVQLIADRDSLILIPAKDLNITSEESKELLEAFNKHFAQDKVQLQYATKDSWYLSIVQEVDIKTTVIDQLYYKPLNDAYPKGNASTYWKSLLNEAQMLFYAHPVNEKRRDKGMPEINSIWVWGEGKINTDDIKIRKNTNIYSNNLYLKGIAKQTKSNIYAEPTSNKGDGDGTVSQHDLICLDSISKQLTNYSAQQWFNCLKNLDKQWFEPFYQDLKAGKIDSLLIDLGMAKRYHLTPKHLNRFWRFTKSYSKNIHKF